MNTIQTTPVIRITRRKLLSVNKTFQKSWSRDIRHQPWYVKNTRRKSEHWSILMILQYMHFSSVDLILPFMSLLATQKKSVKKQKRIGKAKCNIIEWHIYVCRCIQKRPVVVLLPDACSAQRTLANNKMPHLSSKVPLLHLLSMSCQMSLTEDIYRRVPGND